MSNKALNWAWDAAIERAGAKFLLVALADHAGDHNGEDWTCYPSMERLKRMTGQSTKTVERSLEWLIEQGWISRRIKPGRRRVDGLYEYTLRRDRASQPSDILTDDQTAQARASSDKMSDGHGARSSDNLDPIIRHSVHDHPTFCPIPPHPPIELNPHRTLSNPERAGARTDPDPGSDGQEEASGTAAVDGAVIRAWLRLKVGWAKVSPGRLAPRPAERAFRREAALTAPERIADAGLRYLAQDRDVAKFGAMRLQVWLDEKRYEPWLTAGDGGRSSGPGVVPGSPGWNGPAEVRAAVVAQRDEAFAASYLDPSAWDGGRILTRTGFAAAKLAALELDGVDGVEVRA